MFSTVGTSITTFRASFIMPIVFIAPSMEPAPHMSYFISSISADGLSEMPPVSNVTPLPTNTTGAAPFLPPLCSSTMNFGGKYDPFDTESRVFMPSFSISFFSRMVHLNLYALARSFAVLAK